MVEILELHSTIRKQENTLRSAKSIKRSLDHLYHSTTCGDEGTRTPDPLRAKQVLFQLSYIPFGEWG